MHPDRSHAMCSALATALDWLSRKPDDASAQDHAKTVLALHNLLVLDGRFIVRIVNNGDGYGLGDTVRHTLSDPLVEFYDGDQDPAKFGLRGQFVTRYLLSTLMEDRYTLSDGGLRLDAGLSDWRITPAGMRTLFVHLDAQPQPAQD